MAHSYESHRCIIRVWHTRIDPYYIYLFQFFHRFFTLLLLLTPATKISSLYVCVKEEEEEVKLAASSLVSGVEGVAKKKKKKRVPSFSSPFLLLFSLLIISLYPCIYVLLIVKLIFYVGSAHSYNYFLCYTSYRHLRNLVLYLQICLCFSWSSVDVLTTLYVKS